MPQQPQPQLVPRQVQQPEQPLVQQEPERLRELQDVFQREAERFQVLPLDDRVTERENPDVAGRLEHAAGPAAQRQHAVVLRQVKRGQRAQRRRVRRRRVVRRAELRVVRRAPPVLFLLPMWCSCV